MTRHVRNLGELLSRERGAFVWLPGVVMAAVVVLFAIRQAPAELTLYTQSRGTRVVLGPLHGPNADDFARGLRQSMGRHRELSVVTADLVQARLHDVGSPGPVQSEPLAWIRATRVLKAQFYVCGDLRPAGDGLVAVVEVWEAASERPMHRFTAADLDAVTLGAALGDSVVAGLFDPQRPSPAMP